MKAEERAKKDIDKLETLIVKFKEKKLDTKYEKTFLHSLNYLNDAKYFYEKKDYFSAFGAANYAYGCLDGLLILEGIYETL